MTQTTVSSCPGKVLLAGGYLVLDPAYQGLVLSTPSRFYTVVQSAGEPRDVSSGLEAINITVKSPQFEDGLWVYQVKREDGGEWELEQVDKEGGGNSFVELSVQSSLLLAAALAPSATYSDLDITIVGSNDFYSQPRESATPPIPFAPLNCTIRNVHKTGLGSSAAMVTSLTSTLLLHLIAPTPVGANPLQSGVPDPAALASRSRAPGGGNDGFAHPSVEAAAASGKRPAMPDHSMLQLLHNLAQYVHSLAQGKVGSGFDVSAALWGSQVYRRFAVECLGGLLDGAEKPTSASLLKALSPQLNLSWIQPATAAVVSPFALPPGVTLLLADVDTGSNTPSMVGKVLAWKKAKPDEARQVWDALKASNADLALVFAELTILAGGDPVAYQALLSELAATPSGDWPKEGPFARAKDHILTTRALMRQMGEASDVPIEPPMQTALLDACSALPGVLGAGVPGAGGYDAIWVLAVAPEEPAVSPLVKVEETLVGWKEMSVRPLSREAWVVGGREEGEKGLLREVLEGVPGLAEAVKGWK